jgi:uncharacterized integral membrane protein
MTILTPFTHPRDSRWRGPQHHHYTISLLKTLLLLLFIVLIIVNYTSFMYSFNNREYDARYIEFSSVYPLSPLP